MDKISSSEIEQEVFKIIGGLNETMKYLMKETLVIWYDPNADSKENSKFLEELKVISDVKTFINWQEAVGYLKDTETPTCHVITSGFNSELFVREISQLEHIYSIHVFRNNTEDPKKWTYKYQKVMSVDSEFRQLLIHLKVLIWYSRLKTEELSNPKNENEEIIVKCDINDILKRFVKESQIIWYEPSADSDKNSKILEDLKGISDVKTFVIWREAVEYLKNPGTPTCQVIASGSDSELFVKEISQLKNICSIHILCNDIDDQKKWTSQYAKVMSVDNEFHQLKANLEKNLIAWQKKISSLRTDLPVYAPVFDDIDKSKTTYLHFYLKGFVQFQNRSQAKKDLLNLARALYSNNKYIEDFEKNYGEYNMKDILLWYTKESFLYKITNNCLRIATPDSIQYCRLVLRDLEQAVKEKYQLESKNFSGLLYRGAFITDQEWTNLVRNKGKEIELYGFLSTSKDKLVALSFVKGATEKKVMITIIVPAAPEKGEQGFAEIKEYSQYEGEEEVLFNVMSRFTILEATEEIDNGIKYRHLVLLYGAQAMRRFASNSPPVKIKYEDLKRCHICGIEILILNSPIVLVNPIRCNEYSCLNCLEEYHKKNGKALICVPPSLSTTSTSLEIEGFAMEYKSYLNLPFYGSQCDKCQSEKLTYCCKCVNCERKKTYCEKCFYHNECIEQGHLMILEIHPFSFWSEKCTETERNYLSYYQKQLGNFKTSKFFLQALVFSETHKYKEAIEYYSKFLKTHGVKSYSIAAFCYGNLGNAYSSLGDYQRAIEFICKALKIQKTFLGSRHPDTLSSYGNLGNAYISLGEYQKGIKYISKALKNRKVVSGDQHPETASCYHNQASAYYFLAEYQKAIQSFSKALEIRKIVLGDQHPDTASTYQNLGNTYSSLGNYQEATEFYSKALEIQKTLLGDQHPATTSSYISIGNAYYNLGEHQKAIESYSKALEIQKAMLGDQHPDLASSYGNLGNAYQKMVDYQNSIKFYIEGLKIQNKVLGDQHRDTALSHNNLGNVYHSLGEYQKAIESYSKALEIRKKVFGDHHPEIASSYLNLGTTYSYLGEYQKAIQSYSKTLEIQKKFFGEQHPDIASSYSNLGSAHFSLGDYQKAIQYHSKALEIEKKVLGDQHPNTASSYSNLGGAYFGLGEYQKAIEFSSKALELQKKLLGDQNPEIAFSYNNLGNAYAGLGEFQKAIQYYSKTLEIRKKVLGDQHPDTAEAYRNLGNAHCELGEDKKAIQFHSKALEIQKSVFGDQHAATASSYSNLGNAYRNLGENQKALQFSSKALEIQKRCLGDLHPDTAISYHNLGGVYWDLGERQKAIQYLSKALEITKVVLGEQHPDTADTYNNLGHAYFGLGEHQKAIQSYSKALEIQKKIFGPMHPNTLNTFKILKETMELAPHSKN